MKRSFASFTFGCRVNEAEKIAIDRKLRAFGFIYSDDKPDVYIINTCAVTGKAEREARQFIRRIRRKFPDTILLVTGCLATLWKTERYRMRETDLLVSNSDKQQIPYLLRSFLIPPTASEQHSDTGKIKPTQQKNAGDKFIDSGRLILKVQDGCERFCSYCIVPYLRGKPTTKSSKEVIECIRAYKSKIKEVIITGINTEYIGRGHGESLPILLDAVLENTSVSRLSLGSLHPWSITDEFIVWYKNHSDDNRFVHFFHIPIQSASDEILLRMNRGYTKKYISERINQIASVNPDALIGTDIIVGFPGESEENFEETFTFLQTHPISKFHIFRYSNRKNTRASSMEKQYAPLSVYNAKKRSQRLIRLGQLKYRTFISGIPDRSYIGLSLYPDMKGVSRALLENQIVVRLIRNVPPGKMIRIDGITVYKNEVFGDWKLYR